MKRKILFLIGVMSLSNFSVISACSLSELIQEKKATEVKPPNTYDLNSELLLLNKLDFKNKKMNENIKNYYFKKSWFVNFVSKNNRAEFEGKKINSLWTFNSRYWYVLNFDNKVMKYKIIGEKKLVIPKLLSISKSIDIKQKFIIESTNSYANGYIIELGLEPKFSIEQNCKEILKILEQSFNISPNKIMIIRRDLGLKFTIFEGILKISLNEHTKIAYQVENIVTKEKKTYFYTISDLLKKSKFDSEYRKILQDKNAFLYCNYSKNDIFMQLNFSFSKMTASTLIWNNKEIF